MATYLADNSGTIRPTAIVSTFLTSIRLLIYVLRSTFFTRPTRTEDVRVTEGAIVEHFFVLVTPLFSLGEWHAGMGNGSMFVWESHGNIYRYSFRMSGVGGYQAGSISLQRPSFNVSFSSEKGQGFFPGPLFLLFLLGFFRRVLLGLSHRVIIHIRLIGLL